MFLKNVDFDVTFSNKQLDNVTEIIFFLSFFFHLLILKQKGFFPSTLFIMSLWTMCVEVGSYDRRRYSVLFSTPDITLGLEAKVSVTLVKVFFIYNHGISLLFFQVNNYVFISSFSYQPLNYMAKKMLFNVIHKICSFFSVVLKFHAEIVCLVMPSCGRFWPGSRI